MSSKTLEQYLAAACVDRNQIDHHLRASFGVDGKVTFYVHPLNGDGETLDFVVRDNSMVLNVTNNSDVPDAVLEAAQDARAPMHAESAIPKHPSHPDVPRPGDASLVELARGVCHAIEACGASPELTNAVTLASDLVWYLQKPVADQVPALLSGCAEGRAPDPVDDAVRLGHCAANAADSLARLLGHMGTADAPVQAMGELVQSLSRRAITTLGDVELCTTGNVTVTKREG